MAYTEAMSQGLSMADVINTQSVNNASVNSLGINMAQFKRVMFIIRAGSLGSAGTLDGRLQSCFESNFASNVHNIANTNLTQITTSTTPGNNALATIEIRADQVVSNNSADQFVRLQLTGGGNAITVGAIGLGGDAIHKPGNVANDLNNTYLSQRVLPTP
jgi:hypothetical protein